MVDLRICKGCEGFVRRDEENFETMVGVTLECESLGYDLSKRW